MNHNQDNLFSVIVPAHNEAENLLVLLPRLEKSLTGIPHEILIVDNASTDATPETVAEFKKSILTIKLVKEPLLGYGRAVLAGLKAAGGGTLAVIRADNQEKPEDLALMYRDMKDRGLEFSKAIRKNRINDGLKRIIISKIYNFLFKILFSITVKDINAAPKIFSRNFYEKARLESLDWFIDAEMVIKATTMNCTISEIEIEYLPRLKGKSTVRLVHIAQFLKNMLIWYIRLINGKILEK